MSALADARAIGKSLADEIAALAQRERELRADIHGVLGHPDQADEQDAVRAVLIGKHGLSKLSQMNTLHVALADVGHQLAEAHARRQAHNDSVDKLRRQLAREHAAALLPEHRAIAGRLAGALEELLAAAEAEAELHDGLRRQFDHVPLKRLALIDLRGLRNLLQKAKSYQAGDSS
jgi:hypothetical protein